MKESLNHQVKKLFEEKRYDEIPELLKMASKKFWVEEYPKLSFEEKVTFWATNFHQQIRWNVESGIDEMGVFSKEDYESWKKREPNFDELLPAILKRVNVKAEKVYEAIKK